MLSINPNVIKGNIGYDSHMISIVEFKKNKVKICDPDKRIYWIDNKLLDKAISPASKLDFSLTFIYRDKV